MKKMRCLMPVWFLAMAAGFSAIVMLLWNWLMPVIFGLTAISFWQALGLLVLARILFSGFGFHKMMRHGRMHHHGHNFIRERWENMTPEERKEFVKKRMHHMHDGPCGRRDFFGGDHFGFEKETGTDAKKENE